MDLEEFLRANGVDPDLFIEKFARRLINIYEKYDDGIARFAVYGNYEWEKIDINDVLGIPNYVVQDAGFLNHVCLLFDPHGDNYHSRANGMLKYKSEEIVKNLIESFKKESIRLYGIGDKYFVSSNGNHRTNLLMLHYLMESFKGVQADGKLIISAEVERLDEVKTFTNYIGSLLWDESFKVYNDLDENYTKNGKAHVEYHGEVFIMNDDELIDFLYERLNALKELDEDYYVDAIEIMWDKYRREETGLFKKFINQYLPELNSIMNLEDYASLDSEIRTNLIEGVSYGNS